MILAMKALRPPTAIETERLILRPPGLHDAPVIFERYAQDHDVTRYLAWRPAASIDDTVVFLRRCQRVWESGEAFPYAMILAGDDKPIGMIELRPRGHRVELGYVLARPYWNQGYTTEAARAVVDWALAQPGVFRVWAVCDVENAASTRVLEKAGMQREGVLRRWLIHPNVSDTPRDCWCLSIAK